MTKTAYRIHNPAVVKRLGFETTLDIAGNLLLAGCLLFVVISFFAFGLFGIVPAAAFAFSGAIFWLICRAMAELLRIQKTIAGIPYSGKIVGTEMTACDTCSECGAILHAQHYCDGCGLTVTPNASPVNHN